MSPTAISRVRWFSYATLGIAFSWGGTVGAIRYEAKAVIVEQQRTARLDSTQSDSIHATALRIDHVERDIESLVLSSCLKSKLELEKLYLRCADHAVRLQP